MSGLTSAATKTMKTKLTTQIGIALFAAAMITFTGCTTGVNSTSLAPLQQAVTGGLIAAYPQLAPDIALAVPILDSLQGGTLDPVAVQAALQKSGVTDTNSATALVVLAAVQDVLASTNSTQSTSALLKLATAGAAAGIPANTSASAPAKPTSAQIQAAIAKLRAKAKIKAVAAPVAVTAPKTAVIYVTNLVPVVTVAPAK
jgi:hypothetical protein